MHPAVEKMSHLKVSTNKVLAQLDSFKNVSSMQLMLSAGGRERAHSSGSGCFRTPSSPILEDRTTLVRRLQEAPIRRGAQQEGSDGKVTPTKVLRASRHPFVWFLLIVINVPAMYVALQRPR